MDKNNLPIFGISGAAGSGKDTFAAMLLEELQKRGIVGYEQYSFARPLKEFCQHVFGFTDDEVYDQKVKEQEFFYNYNKPLFKARFTLALKDLFLALDAKHVISGKFDEEVDDLFLAFIDVLHKQTVANDPLTSMIGWFKPSIATINFRSTPRIILQLVGTEFFRDCIYEEFWTAIAPKHAVIVSDMRFLNEVDSVLNNKGVTIGISGRNNVLSSSGHASENVMPVINRCKYHIINNKTLEDLKSEAVKIIDIEFGATK